MKEIKKISDLINPFISEINKKIYRENKDICIYDLWDEIIEKENLPNSSTLEDIRNSVIFVHVNHPGMAQQIRIKKFKILQAFNQKFPDMKLKNINIFIDSVFEK